MGHDFFRTLRQLNGHIFRSEALRRFATGAKILRIVQPLANKP